jgi:ABC-type nitrate/sulfonate/bicarbonate transport system permease component
LTKRYRILATALEIAVPLLLLRLLDVWTAKQDSFYIPPLRDVLSTFNDTWLFERVDSDVVPSLTRMGAGFAIAVAAGVAFGLLLGRERRVRRAAAPIVEFLRAIPPPALLPFAILVMGVGASMKIFVIAFVCVWPILLNTIDGAAGIDPTLEDSTRVYGIERRDNLLRVVLPAAGPQIFAGIRTAVSLALILMVISEMVASTNGIGYFVLQSQRTFAIPEMWSGILLLGILGYTLNGAFVLIERRVLRWHRGARASALS